MGIVKTWLYDKNNQKVSPNVLLDQILLEDGVSSFQSKYNKDITDCKEAAIISDNDIISSYIKDGAITDSKLDKEAVSSASLQI